jgi:hypothetical protein
MGRANPGDSHLWEEAYEHISTVVLNILQAEFGAAPATK